MKLYIPTADWELADWLAGVRKSQGQETLNLVQKTKFLQRKPLQFLFYSVCFLFLYYSQLSNLPKKFSNSKSSFTFHFQGLGIESVDKNVEEFGKENPYYLRPMRILQIGQSRIY